MKKGNLFKKRNGLFCVCNEQWPLLPSSESAVVCSSARIQPTTVSCCARKTTLINLRVLLAAFETRAVTIFLVRNVLGAALRSKRSNWFMKQRQRAEIQLISWLHYLSYFLRGIC
jgi:hypothetical protein